jgi:hypothetical protein
VLQPVDHVPGYSDIFFHRMTPASGRQGSRRGEAAFRRAAGRIARAAVQFAKCFEDGIDTVGRFQSLRSPQGGHEVIAEASEAQEARIARFSANVRDGCVTTSLGCSKTVPGCRSALKTGRWPYWYVRGCMMAYR